MTATAAAIAEEIVCSGSAEEKLGDIHEPRPAREAPEHGRHEADVQSGVVSVRRRVHDVSILSLIALIQIAWIAALVYGAWLLA